MMIIFSTTVMFDEIDIGKGKGKGGRGEKKSILSLA